MHGKDEVRVLGLVRAEGGGKGKGCTKNLGVSSWHNNLLSFPQTLTSRPWDGRGLWKEEEQRDQERRGSFSLWGSGV